MSKRFLLPAACMLAAALGLISLATTPSMAALRLHAPQIVRLPAPTVTPLDLAVGDLGGTAAPEIGMYGSDGRLHVFQNSAGGWSEVYASSAANQYQGPTPTVRFTDDPGIAPGAGFGAGQFLFNTLTIPEEQSIVSVRRSTGGTWSDAALFNYMTSIPLAGAFSAPGVLPVAFDPGSTRIAVQGGSFFDPEFRIYLPGAGNVSGPHPLLPHNIGPGGYCDQFATLTGAVIGDFTGSGNNSIAIASNHAPNFTNELWIGQTGSATPTSTTGCTPWTRFTMPVPGDYPVQIEVGNFDGNAATDLIVRYSTGTLASARGTVGAATFTMASVSSLTGSVTDMVVADLNNDGISDIVKSFSSPPGYEVLMNNGSGSFTATFYSTAGMGGAVSSVAVADLDGDTIMDLLLGQPAADYPRLLILPGSGTGPFPPPPLYSVGTLEPSTISLGDFDDDGDLDVALGGTDNDLGDGNHPLGVMPNLLTSGFGAPSTAFTLYGTNRIVDVSPYRHNPSTPTSIAGFGNDFRLVVQGNGDGTLQSFTPLYNYALPIRGFRMVDFDGIGDLDMVWLETDQTNDSSTVFVYRTFGYETHPLPGIHDGLAVVDWNEDGAPDIVTLDLTSAELHIMLRDPADPASFPSSAAYTVSVPLGSQLAANGRPFVVLPRTIGHPQFIAVRSGDEEVTRQVQVFANVPGTSIGTWDLTESANGFVAGFAAGDVDGDDISDVLLAEVVGSSTHIRLLHGTPAGNFAPTTVLLYPDHIVTSMAVGDITGDGFGDLVLSTATSLFAASRLPLSSALGVTASAGMVAIPAVPTYSGTEGVGDRPRPVSGLGSLAFSVAPNPSRGSTTRLGFALAEAGTVSAELFDLSGRRLRSLMHGQRPAGSHSVGIELRDENGQPLQAGVYFVRLQAGREHGTRRIVVLP